MMGLWVSPESEKARFLWAPAKFSNSDIWKENEARVPETFQLVWRVGGGRWDCLLDDAVQGGQVHHQAPVRVAVAALTFLNCNTNNPGSLGTSSWRSSLLPPPSCPLRPLHGVVGQLSIWKVVGPCLWGVCHHLPAQPPRPLPASSSSSASLQSSPSSVLQLQLLRPRPRHRDPGGVWGVWLECGVVNVVRSHKFEAPWLNQI